jgi:hypothetical protein
MAVVLGCHRAPSETSLVHRAAILTKILAREILAIPKRRVQKELQHIAQRMED